MYARFWVFFFCLSNITSAQADSRIEELERQLQQIAADLQLLKKERDSAALDTDNPDLTSPNERQSIDDLRVQAPVESPALVELDPADLSGLEQTTDAHVLSNPWWRNIEVTGFAAAGLYDTGAAGTRKHGGFEVKESSLFIEADVWRDASVFLEVQANRLGKDDQLFLRTGEVYIHWRAHELGLFRNVGLKVGRVDLPFGEEYLAQDSIDNPLITTSASYIYGWDEGILAHADVGRVSLIAAITDGTDKRSAEDHDDKAVNLKASYQPIENLALSLSYMKNGKASKSAVEFGGSHFEPVGASHQSSVGTSSSEFVDGQLYQLDAKYHFRSDSLNGYLAVALGGADIEDEDSFFYRNFTWFTIEPFLSFGEHYYVVVRYSEIGTYDDDEGYHFDGKTFAGGNSAFGYDVQRFQRLGIGFGWTPNPRVALKFEWGKDRFELIDASLLATDNSDRSFTALELAVRL